MIQPFVHSSIVFCLYAVLHNRRSIPSNVLVFHISVSVSSRPAAFLLLIFVSTTLSSSSVNYPSLMTGFRLIIFVIGLSMTLGEFPSRI